VAHQPPARELKRLLGAYWGAVVFGAGVALGAMVEPLDIEPLTEPGLAFFLVVEVVPEASSVVVVPPMVALALAAEPTLADGSTVWAGAGVVACGAGLAGEATVGGGPLIEPLGLAMAPPG
jgi:hypothetical protein